MRIKLLLNAFWFSLCLLSVLSLKAQDVVEPLSAPAIAEPAIVERPIDQSVGPEIKRREHRPVSVFIVPIHDVIAKPTEYIVRRAVKEAIDRKIDVLLLDVDTPGGRLDVTLEIMEMLDKFEGTTMAYVNPEAISAGAYISISCEDVYFAPKGLIGAAEAITATGADVPESANRKLKSYLLAKVRTLTADHPRKADVLRAMMDPDFEFKIGDEVLKPKDELLTLTDDEAMKLYGDLPLLGSGIYASAEALLAAEFGEGNATVETFEITWSERLAQFMDSIQPILMGLGVLCLFIEFKTPGFGVFGISGILLLLVVFLGNYVAGVAGSEPILLFGVGIIFVILELFFMPGGVILAMTGILMILGSLVWSMADIWPSQVEPMGFEIDAGNWMAAIEQLALGLAIALALIIAVYRYLPKTLFWNRLVLETVTPEANPVLAGGGSSQNPSSSVVLPSIGTRAVVLRDLHPAGEIEIEGALYQATVQLGMVKKGTVVEVIGHRQFALLVKPVNTAEAQS
jgi:membrane-bound serine protease (ClpP class)